MSVRETAAAYISSVATIFVGLVSAGLVYEGYQDATDLVQENVFSFVTNEGARSMFANIATSATLAFTVGWLTYNTGKYSYKLVSGGTE